VGIATIVLAAPSGESVQQCPDDSVDAQLLGAVAAELALGECLRPLDEGQVGCPAIQYLQGKRLGRSAMPQ